jgi:hypothetical protein
LWVAWHIGAAAGALEDWYDLDEFTRSVIRRELKQRIEQNNLPFEGNRK